jgi:uncharacterized membrane protein
MHEGDETKSEMIGKNRLESMTDGIFAFSMTLLVTSVILPRSAIINKTSGAALVSLLPDFYHYIIAFFVLATMVFEMDLLILGFSNSTMIYMASPLVEHVVDRCAKKTKSAMEDTLC